MRTPISRVPLLAAAATAALAMLGGCAMVRYAEGESTTAQALIPNAPTRVERGAIRFVHGDFGHLSTDTLETQAVPWNIVSAALVLAEGEGANRQQADERLRLTLERFGFIYPREVVNWSGPTPQGPLGIVRGNVVNDLLGFEVETANLGCASCHAGRLYDAQGDPTSAVWLGAPNTSLDLDAYGDAVYAAVTHGLRHEDALLAMVDVMYPTMPARGRDSLRRYVVPALRERLAALERRTGRALPFRNGGPGITNGVAGTKLRLGVAGDEALARDRGFTSIPDLGGLALRSSLLYDGLYHPPGTRAFRPLSSDRVTPEHRRAMARIPAFFTISTQGGTPASALRAMSRVEEVVAFLDRYQPPPFPGTVNEALGARGAKLYNQECASCHGAFAEVAGRQQLVEFPNRLVPVDDIGTDPGRLESVTPELVTAVNSSAMADYLHAEPRSGYVAPPLTGLWLTAPYLHNGSVPTLWHLMNPRARPRRFEVGGHRLDFARVGIAGEIDGGVYRFAPGYRPVSAPAVFDTSEPGRSNVGHERPFDALDDAQKRALLEYLKRL